MADLNEPKDAYDLLCVLRHCPGGVEDIAGRLVVNDLDHREVVRGALSALEKD